MRTTAFATSLPLPGCTSTHENKALSHRRVRTLCVAKPPPQKPGSHPNSMKRSKRKRKRKDRGEGSQALESITAAQISEKISKAVGIQLILEDVARLSEFFRSLTKPKTSNSANQELQSEVESDTDSRAHLAVIDDSSSYEPRSVTARRIARSYVKTRGAVDRALLAISIRTQSYSKAVARVAGDAVCTLLTAGHEAFPGLRLDRAKDAVANALEDGWTPLSVFQWQLLPGSSEQIKERRKQRIQQISRVLRGAGVDGFLSSAGSAFSGVGRTVEKLAPIAFQGVAKKSFGYVDRRQSQKPERRTLGSSVTRPSKRKLRTQHKKATHHDDISAKQSLTSTGKRMGLIHKPVVKPQGATDSHTKVANRNYGESSQKTVRRTDHGTYRIEKEPTLETESDVPGTSIAADSEEITGEMAPRQRAALARNSAIVLATGAMAAASMTVSIPTAITFSTLIVTSMAVSGAKAANAAEYQAYRHPNARQSRSLQNLEGAFTKLSTATIRHSGNTRGSESLAEQDISTKGGTVSKRFSSSFEASTKDKESSDTRTIEASAYTVSAPQPSLLSIPVIGILFSCLDSAAFHMEKLIGTLLRRSPLKHADFKRRDDWELLRSFQRRSEPD